MSLLSHLVTRLRHHPESSSWWLSIAITLLLALSIPIFGPSIYLWKVNNFKWIIFSLVYVACEIGTGFLLYRFYAPASWSLLRLFMLGFARVFVSTHIAYALASFAMPWPLEKYWDILAKEPLTYIYWPLLWLNTWGLAVIQATLNFYFLKKLVPKKN